MRRLIFLRVVVLLSSVIAGSARAGLLVVQDDRYVSNPSSGILRPAPGDSLFDGTASGPDGAASQNSTLTANGFSASGDLSIDAAGGVGGDSVFDVQFTVDVPTTFTISGLIDATEEANTAFLGDSTGTIHTFAHILSLNGVFEPGTTYRLFVGLQTAPGNLQTTGDFQFSLVPEPEPILLLTALGLAGLTVTRWRPRRDSNARPAA